MESHKTGRQRWRFWLGVSLLGALLAALLGIGWWQDHRTQSIELNALRAEIGSLEPQDQPKNLRAENDDLIHFIDEAYTLLQEEGIHVQLDLEVDEDGRYRLRADSVELTDELKAKLREIKAQP